MIAGPAEFISAIHAFGYAKQFVDRELGEKPAAKSEIPGKNLFLICKDPVYKAFLDQHVIGQEHAKVFSVAVHNHYKRLASELNIGENKLDQFSSELNDVEIEILTALLIGPPAVEKPILPVPLPECSMQPCHGCDHLDRSRLCGG